MSSTDRFLRNILAVQGAFYLAVNLWALVGTRHFLSYNNPGAQIFEARSFAALCLVLALYFLAGAWREGLQRPAAFLGLGSSVAIALVELFHLPEIGWTLLWIDLFTELAFAALYVNILFFHRESPSAVSAAAKPEEPEERSSSADPSVSPESPASSDSSSSSDSSDSSASSSSSDSSPDSPSETSPVTTSDDKETDLL